MSQAVILKVYGNIFPVAKSLAAELSDCVKMAMGETPATEIINWSDDLLVITFEGIYFPADEALEIIRRYLKNQVLAGAAPTGKLDMLDLENWTLIRYLFTENKIVSKKAPLNNVLDYSGH